MWSIKKEECLGCAACVGVCQKVAIGIEGNRAVNNKELCNLCGLCKEICPVGAIEVSKND